MKADETRLKIINTIFSPAAPVENLSLFVGRDPYIARIKEAIEERGQHFMVYGGRGVGKTSLLNAVMQLFKNVNSLKITCNRSDTFDSIWRKAIQKIQLYMSEPGLGFRPADKVVPVEVPLPEGPIEPSIVEKALEICEDYTLIVFDEFDSITDEDTLIAMADTLKALSDNNPNVTLALIGIAENVDELLGEHPSIERCVKQVHLPEMSRTESLLLIAQGMNILQMTMDEVVADRIVDYASGFAHYIHLLCKNSARLCLNQGKTHIDETTFNHAVVESIQHSNHSLQQAYKKATQVTRDEARFEDVVVACALVHTDESNSFTTEDVLEVYNRITGENVKKEAITYNLGMLCKEERGEILLKTEHAPRSRFKVKNPLMKAYAKLKLHQRKTGH